MAPHMPVTPVIVTCPSCSTDNRVLPRQRALPRCSACDTVLPWIVRADPGRFDEAIVAPIPVLVDLWAPWCSPCATVSPIVDLMGHEYAGRLKVVKLEIDRAYDVAKRYGVESIPLLLVLDDGREVDRVAGEITADTLREVLERHVPAGAGDPAV
jgi:thioredoxin 2